MPKQSPVYRAEPRPITPGVPGFGPESSHLKKSNPLKKRELLEFVWFCEHSAATILPDGRRRNATHDASARRPSTLPLQVEPHCGRAAARDSDQSSTFKEFFPARRLAASNRPCRRHPGSLPGQGKPQKPAGAASPRVRFKGALTIMR